MAIAKFLYGLECEAHSIKLQGKWKCTFVGSFIYFTLRFALLCFLPMLIHICGYIFFFLFFFLSFQNYSTFFRILFSFRIQFTLFENENYYKASNWYTICANIPSEYVVRVCLCIWFAKKKSNIKYSARCALSFFYCSCLFI